MQVREGTSKRICLQQTFPEVPGKVFGKEKVIRCLVISVCSGRFQD